MLDLISSHSLVWASTENTQRWSCSTCRLWKYSSKSQWADKQNVQWKSKNTMGVTSKTPLTSWTCRHVSVSICFHHPSTWKVYSITPNLILRLLPQYIQKLLWYFSSDKRRSHREAPAVISSKVLCNGPSLEQCLPQCYSWSHIILSVNDFPKNLSPSPRPSGLSNMERVQGNNRFFQALTFELQSNLWG